MPPAFHTGRLSLTADAEYFWTSANYDDEGESDKLFNDGSYKNLSTVYGATYFFPDGWSLGGGLGYAYAQSDGFENRSNGVFTHIYVLGQKLFSFSPVRLIPEVKATISFDEVDRDGDEVLASDGANELLLGSWLTYDFWRLRSYGYLGYNYRDDGRSSLMPWRLGLGFRQTTFNFSGELTGAESITDDDYTDNRFERTQVTSQVDASSLRYYSVNPRWIEMRLQGGVEFIDNWTFNLGFAKTISGENTADGQSAFLNLTWNIETEEPTKPTRTRPSYNVKEEPSARQNQDQEVRPRRDSDKQQEEFQPLLEDDYNSVFEGDD